MVDRVSLADRLVGVMAAAVKLSPQPSGDPRSLLTMAVDEHINSLHQAFMSTYGNIDRLRQLAIRLGEKPKRTRKARDMAAEAKEAANRG